MPVARARLFDELTVQQVVEKLAAAWDDQEATVLALLADLLEANKSQHGDEGVAFYYRHPLETENGNGSVNYHPLKIPFRNIVYALQITGLNDELKMEEKRFRLVKDDYELRNLKIIQRITQRLPLPVSLNIKVSLSDIFVNKFEITRFLLDNDLPVPQGWREAAAPGDGLNQRARSKGGKKSRWDTGLQAFIDWLHSEITADGTPFTLSTIQRWMENNAPEYDALETDIPDCDDVYFADGKMSWTNSRSTHKSCALRTLEHYIRRIKST